MRTIIKKSILTLFLFFTVFFSFSGFVSAQVCTLGNPTECATGSGCVENPNNLGQGVCQNANFSVSNTFVPPTATETFSDFICSATIFFSQDIIPPIAVLMTLIVGFLFLTSGGNPEKIKLANKVLVFTILGIVVVLLSPGIVALISNIFGSSAGVATPNCVGTNGSNVIVNALVGLVNWMAWFVAIISVTAGLYSGFLYMTSSGNSEQLSRAFKTFIFAIIGTAIAILAFSILSIVEIFIR